MITTNDVLARLRNGESMDTIGQSIADILNAANEAYAAEQEAAKAKVAAAEKAQAKRALAGDLVDIIYSYGELVAPDAVTLLDDVDDSDIDAMVETLDQMFNMMVSLMSLKGELEKAAVTAKPGCKKPKSDDEVLANFIKSLM